jgi:hypothetical protein
MMLRDHFRIIGNDKGLIRNVLSNIGRVLGDTEHVLGIIGNVLVKEICQVVVNYHV